MCRGDAENNRNSRFHCDLYCVSYIGYAPGKQIQRADSCLLYTSIYADIYDDSMWLIDLVENLLYATRIEEGRMTLNTSMELLSDIVDEALKYIGRKAGKHRISVSCEDDLLLVRADGKLIVQVIVNIVDNAIKYTAPGSEILITIKRNGDMAEIAIGDNGEGIPDKMCIRDSITG